MAKQISVFQSTDGLKTFATELEADAYDHAATMRSDIDRYIALMNLGKAEATRAAKYISGFALMMAGEPVDTTPVGDDDTTPPAVTGA